MLRLVAVLTLLTLPAVLHGQAWQQYASMADAGFSAPDLEQARQQAIETGSAAVMIVHRGVAVAASALGGILETVEDHYCGRLFPPGDAIAMARAVTTLLADADLDRDRRGLSLDRLAMAVGNQRSGNAGQVRFVQQLKLVLFEIGDASFRGKHSVRRRQVNLL